MADSIQDLYDLLQRYDDRVRLEERKVRGAERRLEKAKADSQRMRQSIAKEIRDRSASFIGYDPDPVVCRGPEGPVLLRAKTQDRYGSRLTDSELDLLETRLTEAPDA